MGPDASWRNRVDLQGKEKKSSSRRAEPSLIGGRKASEHRDRGDNGLHSSRIPRPHWETSSVAETGLVIKVRRPHFLPRMLNYFGEQRLRKRLLLL